MLVVDGLFKHAVFCKFVCPIGQFNFIASTVSPLEVEVRDHRVCSSCHTVVGIDPCGLDAWLGEGAKRHVFVVTDHKVEVTGLCGACR